MKEILVGALFAGSGLASGYISRHLHGGMLELPAVGLPFGIVAGLLLVRPLYLVPVVAALHGSVWVGAVYSALFLGAARDSVAFSAAGLLGAVGVTAAVGIGHRSFLRLKPLVITGVAGALAAVPFSGVAFAGFGPSMDPLLALWQAVVGVSLWIQYRFID